MLLFLIRAKFGFQELFTAHFQKCFQIIIASKFLRIKVTAMDPAPEIAPVDLTLESAVRLLVQPSIRSFFVKVSEDEHRTLLALQAVREREKEV